MNRAKLEMVRRKYRDQFKETFGVPIDDFWSRNFGLDVLAFDAWLGPPEDMSTMDYALERFGAAAPALLSALLADEFVASV